jgi:hypothetical protein
MWSALGTRIEPVDIEKTTMYKLNVCELVGFKGIVVTKLQRKEFD